MLIVLNEIVHYHHALYDEDIPFWKQLAAGTGSPVLELGCGTGRVSEAIARSSYSVIGIDKDARALEMNRVASTCGSNLQIHLIRADVSQIGFGIEFPLIIMPCNTLSTLSAPARRDTLAGVQRHLRVGGLFSFSVLNPCLFAKMPEAGGSEVEEVFSFPGGECDVQVSSEWQRTEEGMELRWHYDLMTADGETNRLTKSVFHYYIPADSYAEEIESVGLRVVQTYGGFLKEEYEDHSPYLIMVVARDQ